MRTPANSTQGHTAYKKTLSNLWMSFLFYAHETIKNVKQNTARKNVTYWAPIDIYLSNLWMYFLLPFLFFYFAHELLTSKIWFGTSTISALLLLFALIKPLASLTSDEILFNL